MLNRDNDPQSLPAPTLPRLTSPDWLCIAVLVASVLLFLIARGPFSLPPIEDAAMLLRYSENLAQGHGFVWNIGEQPVDGATDFLFMLAVATVNRLGAGLLEASHLVGIAAHLATLPLMYWAIRVVGRAPLPSALAATSYVAFGPGLRYVEGSFGTTLFAFTVALDATAWVLVSQYPQNATIRWVFGLCCLLMGLARPEGAALALFALLALLVLDSAGQRKAIIFAFALTFGCFGSLYFAWHWLHFGYPLPNPTYVRTLFGGHLTSLRDSLKNSALFLCPLFPLVAFQLTRGSHRSTTAFMLPIVGFTCLWLALSHSMNFGRRYQYPIVPFAFITWAPALRATCAQLTARYRSLLFLSCSAVAVSALVFMYRSLGTWTDGRRTVGLALSRFSHDYTMATTEAGLLPLYSRWRVLDAVGLNDSWVAHHGLSRDYLAGYRPALIVLASDPGGSARYRQMTACLYSYIASEHYIPTAAWGAFEFYVAPWLPDSALLVRTIRDAGPDIHTLGVM